MPGWPLFAVAASRDALVALTNQGATAVVSVFVVAALGWAAILSVGAAAHEASWAKRQMTRAAVATAVLAAIGMIALIWIQPAWVGITLLYISGIVWLMTRSVRASLRRVDAIGGALISPSRRKVLLLTTSRWMWIVAFALTVVALIDWGWRGPLAFADGVLAAVFAAAAWWAGVQADRLDWL